LCRSPAFERGRKRSRNALRLLPKNRRVYGESSSIFDLAAVYGAAMVRNHPFIDGNKRVALMVVYAFLEMNGYRLEAPEADAAGIMLALAAGEVDEKVLSTWLKQHSVPVAR